MRRGRRAWLVTFALALCLTSVPVAIAAFTATTANSGNSFEAASTFPGTMKMATGSYAGNGGDDRAISTTFQPDYVIVKDSATREGVARTSTMTGDASKPMGTLTNLVPDNIQSLTATGFTVGTNPRVNETGRTYHWTAFKAGADALKVGTYTGNGTNQPVTGAGFSPEYVTVLGATPQRPVLRFAGMTSSFRFDTGTGIATGITSLDADGFSVGAAPEANTNAVTYHYVAFNHAPGSIHIGSYGGNGADNRDIGGLNFQPGYVHVRANDTAVGRPATQRGASLSGDSTLFFGGSAASTNRIQALQADGFQVGNSGDVNASTVTYHYLALKNTGGGCSQPGPQTVTTNGDAWFDQASPGSNFGADSVLKVASKGPANNMRAVVNFTLPNVPSDCTLTGATLRMYNKSPVSGRTLEALRNTATWAEGTVNWTNQPATAAGAATAATPSTPGWMQWDVLTQVQAMYPSSGHGFKIQDQTEDAGGVEQQFDSKESGSNSPQLVLTFG